MKFLRKLPRIIISTVDLKPRCMTQLQRFGAHTLAVSLLVRMHSNSASTLIRPTVDSLNYLRVTVLKCLYTKLSVSCAGKVDLNYKVNIYSREIGLQMTHH